MSIIVKNKKIIEVRTRELKSVREAREITLQFQYIVVYTNQSKPEKRTTRNDSPKQCSDLTGVHVKIQSVYCLLISKGFGEIPDLDPVFLVEEGLAHHRLTRNVQILIVDVFFVFIVKLDSGGTPITLGK